MKEEEVWIRRFAQTGKKERISKTICSSANGDEVLFDVFNKNVENRVIKTRIPYFFISERKQIGCSFGEKITNAVLSVFSKGYSKVIVVGNDCPQLKARQIRDAFEALNVNKEVIGKDNRGVTYSIGLTRSNFD